MPPGSEELINHIYDRFNARDIEAILEHMHPDVHWPNGWEGGYVNGHGEVREYWTRQWKEIDPKVDPVKIKINTSGTIQVTVHQVAKDLVGKLLSDGYVEHVYTIKDGLIAGMEIGQAAG